MRFAHDTPAQRVVLDSGRAGHHVATEVRRLGARRVMVVAGGSSMSHVGRLTSDVPVVLVWEEVVMHVPVAVAERARAAAHEAGADLLLSVGGGSTLGLAKAVALTSRLPIVAVPTTYAGSEGTSVWGLTEGRTKTTGVDPAVLPATVIYDSELSVGLPVELSVASGLNALAHCVDSLWAPAADPLNAAWAIEGARALADGLPTVVADPGDLAGRDECLYGAYLSAVAFASAGSGLHHKICHVLGGTWNLPHAGTHAVVLPHVLAFNGPAVPELAARLAGALGVPPGRDPAAAADRRLADLRSRLDAPRSLREVGMPEAGLAEAVERVLAVVPPSNPRPVTAADLTSLLSAAWEGAEPTTQRSLR